MNGLPENQMCGVAQGASLFILTEKKCSRCKERKQLPKFSHNKSGKDGLQSICKACCSTYHKQWLAKNRECRREQRKKRRIENEKNRRPQCKKCNNIIHKKGYVPYNELTELQKQKERVRAIKKQAKKRATPRGTIENRMRVNINQSLKGGKDGRKWEELTGYSLDKLMSHLEKKFTQGMNWGNYGEWHIDHIIPNSAFNYSSPNDLDFKNCWALKNLRPLWAEENMSKGKILKVPHQPCLQIG